MAYHIYQKINDDSLSGFAPVIQKWCKSCKDDLLPDGYYTTYGHGEMPATVKARFDPFYDEHIIKFMQSVLLFDRVEYRYDLWAQYYTGGAGHPKHDHWDPGTLFSFIHFIQLPENDNCLKMLRQDTHFKQGDIIFYPPWQEHEVAAPTKEGHRLVVAGNIEILKYELPHGKAVYHNPRYI